MSYLLRLSACLLLCVSLNSFGGLQPRDFDGDYSTAEAFYDDILNITWWADMHMFETIDYYDLNIDDIQKKCEYQVHIHHTGTDDPEKQVADFKASNGAPAMFQENDFTHIADIFKNTYIETVIDKVSEHFKDKFLVCRGRFISMGPQKCLLWHNDQYPRVHIPIFSNPGARMIINNDVFHLDVGNVWFTDTRQQHTAFNANIERRRVHAVFVLYPKDVN